MLKSVKRSFDSTTSSTSDSFSYCSTSSPRKIQFLDPTQQQQSTPFPFATSTTTMSSTTPSTPPSFDINNNNNTYSENTSFQQQQQQQYQHQQPSFVPTPTKKIRGVSQHTSTQLRTESPLAHFPSTTPNTLLETVDHVARVRGVSDNNEKAFSINDVRAILEHALRERDNTLRLEFDSVSAPLSFIVYSLFVLTAQEKE